MRLIAKRRRLVLAGLAVMALAAVLPFGRLSLTLGLVSAVRSVAEGGTRTDSGILETRIMRRFGDRTLEGMTYRSADSPPGIGVVLAAGVSEFGCYHPKLVALSRALAAKGFLVLTPDIETLRRFQISPAAVDELEFWFGQMHSLPGSERVRRTGMAGISFSGTLALIAAARPEIRGRVAFVLGVGCFDDLARCSRLWFGPGPVTVEPGRYPTRYYGRWVMMMNALELLRRQEDRTILHRALEDLLVQREEPPPAGMSPEAERWYRLARMPEGQSDPELAGRIESWIGSKYAGLSPGRAAALLRSPVFLAHGAFDDLIPPEESLGLKQRLTGVDSYLIVSPYITHTHLRQKSLTLWEKTGAVVDIFVFFFHLSGILV